MPWYIRLTIFLFLGRILHPIFNKRIANQRKGRTRRLVWMFFLAALVAVPGALFNDEVTTVPGWQLGLMVGIGLLNSFACYCSWRAIAVSLSRTSLFTQGDDLICLTLGFLLLGEGSLLNLPIGAGVALALGAAIIYTLLNAAPGNSAKTEPIWHWIALYSLIWGVAIFSKRYFAVQGMPTMTYMATWYLGSLLGAGVILKFGNREEAEPTEKRQILWYILPAALTAIGSNVYSYWTFQVTPITVVQPIDQVSEMILPLLIGLFIFREAKELTWPKKLAMATGLAGGLLVAFNY